MDNACKWANHRVALKAEVSETTGRGGNRLLRITIEDDGPGLSAEQRAVLGKRGVRLDETKPGSGLGLSIVTDLVQSYQGRLTLSASAMGGLSANLDLPAA
jgi:signal transduction histidine kinase